MFKRIVILFTLLLFSTVVYGGDTSKEVKGVVDNGDDIIIIKSSAFKGKKPLKEFNHLKHQSVVGCDKCHHGLNATGRSIWGNYIIYRCDVCHDGGVEAKGVNTPKKAFHVNCKTCHKAQKKIKGAKVKGSCKECHVKKKKKKRPVIEGC